MSDETKEPFRDLNNYSPFELTVKVVPMLFFHDVEKKVLIVEIKTYFFADEFNSDRESAFPLLSDKIVFKGSLYDAVSDKKMFGTELQTMSSAAREIGKFTDADTLKRMKIDSEETIIEINGERLINGEIDFEGDPSVLFGSAQNKFELLKRKYPQLVQTFYLLVLRLFAARESANQKFFQAILKQIS